MKPKTKDIEVIIKDSPVTFKLSELSPGDIFQRSGDKLLYMAVKRITRTKSDIIDTICLNSGYDEYMAYDTIVTLYNAKIELTRA